MDIKLDKLNDVWLDNGLATFYQLLKELNDEGAFIENLQIDTQSITFTITEKVTFVEELADLIESRIHNLIVNVDDKNTGERKEVKKDHILIQEGKKINGKVAFKESIYDKKLTKQVIEEIFQNLDGQKTTCFFCNRTYKKSIKKLQQASYPFVTKIASLSGIRSGIDNKLPEYISEYCPLCYLCGIIAWLDNSLVYRTIPRDKSILILPNTESLYDLIKLKDSYTGILATEQRWSNIKSDKGKNNIENTPGRYTTFISFYENFLRYVSPDLDNDNWYIIEIPQSGSVKNPKYFNILIETNIAKVIKILTRQENAYFYQVFVKEFYAFHTDPKKGIRNFDQEKILHEKLCESVIKNDFSLFASAFIPQKGIKPGIPKEAFTVLEKLLFYWRIEPMQIENKEDYLKTIGMAGATLAKLIGGRLSLFFKLEKAKNPNQFFEAIQEITRRIIIDDTEKIGTIYPHSLETISKMILENYNNKDGKEFFNTTKNMLLIYTSIRSKRENKKNQEDSK